MIFGLLFTIFFIVCLFLVFKTGISHVIYLFIKNKTREIVKRLEKAEYTTFENDVIYKCCHVSIFKYYPFFCLNSDTWIDLKTRLTPEEKIVDFNIVVISDFFKIGSGLMVCFSSNTGNYFFYKIKVIDLMNSCKKLYLSFNICDIKEIDFVIQSDYMFSLNKGVPGSAKVFFKSGKRLTLIGCYSRFAEKMKCHIENINNENDLRQIDWIKNKLVLLYEKNKISQDKYNILLKRLNMSTTQANRLIYESLLFEK